MDTWENRGEAYSRSFGTLCAGAIDRLLADTPHGTLLDVGCGTGDLGARAASEGREVTAVDSEESMVDMARSRVRGPVLRAALPRLPFLDGTFDAVTANFVVNHVARPVDSVGELARVLGSEGRLAMTVWPSGAPPRASWGAFVGEVLADAEIDPLPRQDLDPALDFERSPTGLGALAERAGLEVVSAELLEWEWSIAPPDLWAGIEGGVAGVGATYLAQTPQTQDRVRRIFDARCADAAASSGTLRFSAAASYVLATRT